MAKYTIDEWIEQFAEMPRSIELHRGLPRERILSFLKENHVNAPEEYIHFTELSNGASLFGNKVIIWEIPERKDTSIPNWKSILYMNSENVKSGIPETEGVFLIAGTYLGEYIGLCMEDEEYNIICISPDTGDSWN